jgi:hypothetical protein
LHVLRERDTWKQHGITVDEQFTRFDSPHLGPRRRHTNPFTLTSSQAHGLFALLEPQEAALRMLVKPLNFMQRRTLSNVSKFLYTCSQVQQANQYDLSIRSLPWTQ